MWADFFQEKKNEKKLGVFRKKREKRLCMFVNLTLKGLAASTLSSSALISESSRSQKNKRIFKDILFTKSFAPFYSAYSPRGPVSILSSTFSKIMQNAIHLDEVEKNCSKFSSSLRSKPDDDLEISFCVFTEISSKKNGGAIYMKNYRYSLFLTKCGFSLCATHLSGGACYVVGYEFLANRCCFYGCVALVSEQAVFSNIRRFARDEAVDNSFNFSYVSQCSPRQSKGARRTVYCSGGMQILTNDNFTNNHVIEEAAGAITSYPTVFTLKFCDFCRSSGNSILWMHLLDETFTLSYCNIYNNTLPGNMSSIIVFEQSRTFISRIVFFQNYALHYMEGTYSTVLQECMFDVKRYVGMFGALNVMEKGTKYYARIRKYKLKFAPTWDCWNYGSRSPKQPGIFNQLLYVQDSSTIAVFVVFGIIISVILVVTIILFMSNQKSNDGELQRIEIG